MKKEIERKGEEDRLVIEKERKGEEDRLVIVSQNLGRLHEKNQKTTDPKKKLAICFQIKSCLIGLNRLQDMIVR